jgi:hypothetical protein
MDKRLIVTGVLIFFLGMLTGYFPALAFPGKPNPGHSASEIGAGTFGEAGDYVFPAGSRVGIGTAPSYNLDVAGDIRWTGTLQGGSIPWARLTNFPSACPAGQYVSGIGGTLTCSSPSAAAQPVIYKWTSNAIGWLPGAKQLIFTCNPPNPFLLLYVNLDVTVWGNDEVHAQIRVVYTDGTFTDFPEEVWKYNLGSCQNGQGGGKEYTIPALFYQLSQGKSIDRVEFYGYRIGSCKSYLGNLNEVYGYTF